jgi:hypothetical protein
MARYPAAASVALLAMALLVLARAQPLGPDAAGADAGARRMLLKAKNKTSTSNPAATPAASAAAAPPASNSTLSAASVNGTVDAAAATPARKRFVRNAYVASDSSLVAMTSFNVLRSAAQLAQPFAAAATTGQFKIDAPTLLTLGSLVAQAGAAANDLATKVSYLVSRSSAPLG